MRQTTLVLLVDTVMLRHATKLYTPKIFQMFQVEYFKIGTVLVSRLKDMMVSQNTK